MIRSLRLSFSVFHRSQSFLFLSSGRLLSHPGGLLMLRRFSNFIFFLPAVFFPPVSFSCFVGFKPSFSFFRQFSAHSGIFYPAICFVLP